MLFLAIFLIVIVRKVESSSSNSVFSGYSTGAQADVIAELPGTNVPFSSNQFSGYLDITDTKALHYMYFESERSPSTDSIIFWTNGGPGTNHSYS